MNTLSRNKGSLTPEQEKRLDGLRTLALADIEARAFAKPFNKDMLNSASNDISELSNKDNNHRVLQLRELLNHEVACFKFILTEINTDGEELTATFNLNNPLLTERTETVTKGDLLMDRFLVHSITSRTVVLEDRSERGAGRFLIAEEYAVVKAE